MTCCAYKTYLEGKNYPKTTREMLDMYSSDMAARIYKDLPEIQELAGDITIFKMAMQKYLLNV